MINVEELRNQVDRLNLTFDLADLISNKMGTLRFTLAAKLMTHWPANKEALL